MLYYNGLVDTIMMGILISLLIIFICLVGYFISFDAEDRSYHMLLIKRCCCPQNDQENNDGESEDDGDDLPTYDEAVAQAPVDNPPEYTPREQNTEVVQETYV